MSFKKFLAPVMSCCCAASSLASSCRAFYKYSDLCAIKLTNNEGSNFYDKYKKLTPGGSDIVYVSKTLSLPRNEEIVKCGCCGYGVRFSDGYVVGHKSLYPLAYSGNYGELDDVFESQDLINKASAEIKKQLTHLVCKKCMIEAISKAPKEEENFEKDSNKYVQCPCKGCKEKSLRIVSLSNLGEPKEPEHPDVKMLKFVLPFAAVGMITYMVLMLACGDDEDCCTKNTKLKKYRITVTPVDNPDDDNSQFEDYV